MCKFVINQSWWYRFTRFQETYFSLRSPCVYDETCKDLFIKLSTLCAFEFSIYIRTAKNAPLYRDFFHNNYFLASSTAILTMALRKVTQLSHFNTAAYILQSARRKGAENMKYKTSWVDIANFSFEFKLKN